MNIRAKYIAATLVCMAVDFASAQPTTYDGITFPDGDVSFADVVVSYEPLFDGGPGPTNPNFIDPASALGPPDYSGGADGIGSVSLGDGGRITLRFSDNALTGSGDNGVDDLHIFEVGPQVEETLVEISVDGVVFIAVGTVAGATSSIDIDPTLDLEGLPATTEFRYVRLTDDTSADGQTGDTVGADVDAVGAISTVIIDCPADVNGDGLVTPADFNAWILAFNNDAPECDQNGDGQCTPADFNAWILNFNAGC